MNKANGGAKVIIRDEEENELDRRWSHLMRQREIPDFFPPSFV
jgi:hypothetical protein